jgi:hypothetical protein
MRTRSVCDTAMLSANALATTTFRADKIKVKYKMQIIITTISHGSCHLSVCVLESLLLKKTNQFRACM